MQVGNSATKYIKIKHKPQYFTRRVEMHGMQLSDYKKQYTFDYRREESARILRKYDDRVPIIVNKNRHSMLPSLEKRKFLVPNEFTCGQFIYVIRDRIKLTQDQALFLFFGGVYLAPSSAPLAQVYAQYRDKDGFLYATIQEESTFGTRSKAISHFSLRQRICRSRE